MLLSLCEHISYLQDTSFLLLFEDQNLLAVWCSEAGKRINIMRTIAGRYTLLENMKYIVEVYEQEGKTIDKLYYGL